MTELERRQFINRIQAAKNNPEAQRTYNKGTITTTTQREPLRTVAPIRSDSAEEDAPHTTHSYLTAAKNATNKNISNTSTLDVNDAEKRMNNLEKRRTTLNTYIAGAKRGNAPKMVQKYEAEMAEVEAQIAALTTELEQARLGDTYSELDALRKTEREKTEAEYKAKRDAYKSNGRQLAVDYQKDPEGVSALFEAAREATSERQKAEQAVDQIQYLNKYQDRTYSETPGADTFREKWGNFWQQSKANYDLGRISQDVTKAFGEYADNPTEENLNYAMALLELQQHHSTKNETVLDDNGAVLPILSQTTAGYLPQAIDQYEAAVPAGLVGSVLGGAFGAPLAGFKTGAAIGGGLAMAKAIKGSAVMGFLQAGVDLETAVAAANDETVLSTLVEMVEAGVDVSTLGTASWLKILLNEALNIGSEYSEEALQQGINIANRRRIEAGEDPSLWGLVKGSAKTIYNALTNRDSEARKEMMEAGEEGAKVALVAGTAGRIATGVTNKLTGSDKSTYDRTSPLAETALEAVQGDTTPAERTNVRMGETTLPQAENGVESRTELPVANRTLESAASAFGKAGRSTFTKFYNEDVSIEKYYSDFADAYLAGREGQNIDSVKSEVLNDAQKQAAYIAGQQDAKNIAAGDGMEYNGENETEVFENGGEEIRLRRGGEWYDSQNPAGEVRGLEEGSGQSQSRGETQYRPADERALNLTYEGRRRSTASLGIEGGSTTDGVQVVSAESAAQHYGELVEKAKSRGLELILVGGGNITVNSASARGFYDGKRIVVRVDHPVFTAEQIFDHEVAHDRIAKGEINIDAVRTRIKERTGADYERLANVYLEAYWAEDETLTEDEIWEEIICDSEAGMNIFSGTSREADATRLMGETKAAASEASGEQSTRGPPAEGKLSRETKAETFRRNFTGEVVPDAYIDLTNAEKAAIKSALKTGYGSIDSDGRGGTVSIKKYCYVFDVVRNGVLVTEVISNDELNIHDNYYGQEDLHGREGNRETAEDNGQPRSGLSHGAQYLSESKKQHTENDRLVRGESESERGRDVREIEGDTQSDITYGPDYAYWRNAVKDTGKASRELHQITELQQQNMLLDDVISQLNEAQKEAETQRKRADKLQGETKRTKVPSVRTEDVNKTTKALLKDYSSQADIKEVAPMVEELANFIVRGGDGENELTWTAVKEKANDIASEIIHNASAIRDDGYHEYTSILKSIKEAKIAFENKGEIADFNDWRKRNFGKLTISKDGTPADMVYQDLQSEYGVGFFPEIITNPADQLLHIAEVADSLAPVYENPFSYQMAEAIEACANDVISTVLSDEVRQTAPTYADRVYKRYQDALAREKQRGRERTKNAVAKVREQRDRKISQLKEHFRDQTTKRQESRKATALRQKIYKHVRKISSELLRPTDKRHIPQELQGPVARLLEAINLESAFEVEYDENGKAHRVKPGESDKSVATKRTKAFAAIKEAYAKIGGELTIDPELFGANGELGLLDEVTKYADTPIAAMNSTELETVWQAVKAIEATIRSANKAFAESRFETISETADSLKKENAGKTERAQYKGIFGTAQKLAGLDMLTPEAFFHRLGNTGDTIFRMMRNAQDKHISLMKEISDFTRNLLKGVNINEWERQLHTVTLGGEQIKLSTAQLMELYALHRRPQAQEHIYVGGIRPDDVTTRKLTKTTKAEPVRGITPEEISKALSKLTAEQVKIAEKLQEFASTKLSDYGNEASVKVYNYKKFLEEMYWPLRINRQEVQSTPETSTAVRSIANKGFTKAVIPNANNSVRIGSIFDTFATHSSEMATYSAWLGTSEDVRRIMNYRFKNESGSSSVKGILDRVHGKGTQYLEQLLADIANGVRSETSYTGGFTGAYKAASVGANLRVVIQQPTAILRAMDMISPKYLLTAKPGGWNKALKYAPIAQWKDWGFFDVHTGRQMKDILFDSDSGLEKARQAGMWLAGKADSYGWGQIWNAVEAETKATKKDLKPGTKEFYEAVAKRFTEIIDKTQVVDGILQRSQIMRNPGDVTKMATSFMGEPTKQYNMLLNSVYDLTTSKDKAQRDKAKKQLARTTFTLAVSGVANAAAQSVIDAVRDDDKEKDFWDKWFEAFIGLTGEEETFGDKWKAFWGGNVGNLANPAQYIPFVKDVVSLIQGYDVKRMDMDGLQKLVTAGENFTKSLSGESKYTVGGAMANLFMEAARLMGISVANLKRDVHSLLMLGAVESENYLMQYRLEKFWKNVDHSSNKKVFYDVLYNAYKNDKEAYDIIYSDLINSGYGEDKVRGAMEDRMKAEQGVTKAEELDERYMTPTQQKEYDASMKTMQGSSVWKNANAEQRAKLEDRLYDLTAGSADAMQKKIGEGSEYGLNATEYLLYKTALDMVDEPNKNGNYGTYTNAEKEKAARMVGGLSENEILFLVGKK